jgi:hypothetical protein
VIDERKLTAESFEMAKSLSEMYNAKTRIDVILNSINVRFGTRDMMNRWSRSLGFILNEFKMKLPSAWSAVFAKELLNDDKSLQIDNCITMMLQLPEGIKDEIENYIESRHSTYALNRPDNDDKRSSEDIRSNPASN